jgi:predicted methyltransferase
MDDETVALGVALLERLEHDELSVADAVDRIETVTTNPMLTREILDRAELEGVVEREDGVLRVTSGAYVSHDTQVIQREGDFECRRCGSGLSTGHFIDLEEGEIGPFGSSCIRKVTGRE